MNLEELAVHDFAIALLKLALTTGHEGAVDYAEIVELAENFGVVFEDYEVYA